MTPLPPEDFNPAQPGPHPHREGRYPSRLLLMGYMGAGKSTIGRLLAQHLHYRFVDTDRLLVSRQGKSISRIFAEEGEGFFRQAELTLLQELLKGTNLVISTGGGTLAREETFQLAQAHGTLIYLEAPLSVLFERVIFSPKDRPIIDVPNAEEQFKQRFQEREPFYQRAHAAISTVDNTPADVVEAIVQWLNEHPTSPSSETTSNVHPGATTDDPPH